MKKYSNNIINKVGGCNNCCDQTDFSYLNLTERQDAAVPNNSVFITDGTLSGFPAGSLVFKDSSGNYQLLQNDTPCPLPMTRAALLALRTAGSLNINCTYVITDFVQGQLVVGTTITMRADSATELSERVSVNTTYDNEGWKGIYDIDRNLVIELHDNLNNIVRHNTGVAISNFDWGNPTYTSFLVDSSSLTADIGNTALKVRVSLTNASSLNITGFTGVINDLQIKNASTVNLSGANGTWRLSDFLDAANFNATNYSGGGNSYLNIYKEGAINISNTTAQVQFVGCNFETSTLNNSGITTGTLSVLNARCKVLNLTRTEGVGNLNINGSSSFENITLVHSTGTMTLNSSTFHSITLTQDTDNGASMNLVQVTASKGSSIQNRSSGLLTMSQTDVSNSTVRRLAGALGTLTVNTSEINTSSIITQDITATADTTITFSLISSRSTVTNSGGATLVLARAYLEDIATISNSLGSGGNLTINNARIFASTVRKQSLSTSGSLLIQDACEILSSSVVQTNGTGNVTLNQTTLMNISSLNVNNGDRNYTFTRCLLNNAATITLTGTNSAITDLHTNLEMFEGSTYNNSSTGLVNNITRLHLVGLSSIFTLSGGGLVATRFTIFNSTFTRTVNILGTYEIINMSGLSTLTINNHLSGMILRYLELSGRSVMLVNKTTAGDLFNIQILQAGTLNVQSTAGTITNLLVEQGVLDFNGGVISVCSKKLGGTWTINSGTQSGTHHLDTTNKTTAVSNTNRVDYLGLTSTVPIL